MPQYPRRIDGSNGYNQPGMVARAARGRGCLPKQVIEIADRSVPGFRAIHQSPLWHVLGLRRTGWRPLVYEPALYDREWVHAVGLDRRSLGTWWSVPGTLTGFPEPLIRRAGRLTSLSALALLLEAGVSPLHFCCQAMAADYAADVFARLEAGAEECRSGSRHGGRPFQAVAAAIGKLASELNSAYKLGERTGLKLPVFRSRPPMSNRFTGIGKCFGAG